MQLQEKGPIEDLQDPAKQPELADVARIAELTEELSSPSASRRRKAARALEAFGPQVLPVLIKVFSDPDLSVRKEAVAAVAGLGGAAVSSLLEALNEEDADLRRVVVVTLGEIGPEASAAVEPLTQALTDEWLGGCATAALEKITGRKKRVARPWVDRVVPWLLAGWLVVVAAGLVGSVVSWSEMGLFGVSSGATGSASVLGGMGVALGAILGWSRDSIRGLLILPFVLGVGGLLAGLFLGGIVGGMIEPISRALGGS